MLRVTQNNQKRQICLGGIWLSILLGLSIAPELVLAGPPDRLSGWAWSDNVGWISMNCTNTDSCEEVDYGVTVHNSDDDDQSMSGWAWSDNVGWIDFSHAHMVASDRSFGGNTLVYSTVEEPYCASADPYQTKSDGLTGETGSDYNCSTNTGGTGDENDGWSGVISLSSLSGSGTVAYGPTADATDNIDDNWDWEDEQYYLMDGYAWGGDTVGWIKFSCQDSDAGGPDTNTCGQVGYGTYLEPFYFHFTADKGLSKLDAVGNGDTVTYAWTLIPESEIDSCIASGGVGSWSADNNKSKSTGPSPVRESVKQDSSTSSELIATTLKCTNKDGKHITRNLSIHIKTAAPVLGFSATDYNIPRNTKTQLMWSTQNIASCTNSGGDSRWGGAAATGTDLAYTSDALQATSTKYSMQCSSPHEDYYPDPIDRTIEITVQKLKVDLYLEDEAGERIVDERRLRAYTEKDNTSLVWKTEFATGGCEASGDWSGTKVEAHPTNDVVDGREPAQVSHSVTSSEFTLICKGEEGQEVERSVKLSVRANPGFSEEITNDLR